MKWLWRGEVDTGERGCQSPSRKLVVPYFSLALFLLCTVALLLRLYAAADNFWLDEIFTYFLAMNQVHVVSDVFTGIKVEHQLLVTLSMYLSGDRLNWVWYRLPSVIAGTGVLALMALVGYRRMRPAALIVTLALAAVSYPLVVYSSEARGYAPAAFFSLSMFIFMETYRRHRNQLFLLGFWSTSVIAVLYHPAAVCIYLSIGLWSLVREWRLGGGLPRVLREMALCNAVPLAFMAWLYFAVMRQWGSVGGDVLSLTRVIGDTMAVALGFPMQAEYRLGSLFLGGALITAGFVILARLVRSDIWIFYLSALLLTPALMLGISGRPYIYVRYFVVLFPFFYLMLGEALDAVAGRFKEARVAVVGLCVLMLLGNALSTADFLRVGRGGYLDAVTYMAANTPWPDVKVGGDHDFRNGLPVSFYSRYLPKNRSMVYLRHNAWPPEGPDWLLIHNTCSEAFVPKRFVKVRGGTYRLAKSYPVLGLSGVGWHLYRNDSRL
ncbi:MAG: hypothetical protein C0394_00665 [Syntrophus sp. (in: bacteria)]|nr:hypothetical protein [Syntrophus sp. (in: bacteria)]